MKSVLSFLKPILAKKPKQSFISDWINQVATLLKANITLEEAVNITAKLQHSGPQKKFIQTMQQSLKQGLSFSLAAAKNPQFNTLDLAMIQAGETSGQMAIALEKLASYHLRSNCMRQQIKQALFYPITVLITSTAVAIFLLKFIVPKFSAFYHSLDASLPKLTQVIMTIASHLNAKLITNPVFIIISCLLFILIYFLKKQLKTSVITDITLFNTPVIKQIKLNNTLLKFFDTLLLLCQSHCHLDNAFLIAGKASSSQIFAAYGQQTSFDLNQGRSLLKSLEKHKYLPKMAVQMLAVGEQSNHLETVLQQLAQHHYQQLNQAIQSSIKMIEPLTMILIGIILGLITIAIYLPIFNIGAVL